MGCFSAAWLVQFIVWLIVVCAIVAIGRRVLPIVLGWLGVAGEVVMQVIVDCHGRDAGVAVGAGVMPIDRDVLKVWLWILVGLLLAWGAIIAIAWKYIS